MNWLRHHWGWGIIAIVVILSLAVTVQFTKDTNHIADWIFNFLKDWAVILSAAITLLLVVAAFITIIVTTEQRRKSIRPSLQVDHISYWYRNIGLPNTHRKALMPGIELKVKNVGTGPALNIQISASAVINVTRGNPLKGTFCKLYWELIETSKDIYLDGRTLDPIPLRLNLVQSEKIAPAYKIAQLYKAILKKSKGVKPKELEHEMNIKFKYNDLDHNPLTDLRTLHVGNEIFALRFEENEPKLIPGDSGYPEKPPALF